MKSKVVGVLLISLDILWGLMMFSNISITHIIGALNALLSGIVFYVIAVE